MQARAIASAILLLSSASCAASPEPARPLAREPAMASAGAERPPRSRTLEGLAEGAILFDDLGEHHREITTRSPEAQAFFDQGLRLTYGFNHDEAARAFARAGELDPQCAMCFWGAAYVLGPNYNVPMLPDRAAAAWDALQRARAAAPRATPVEQALIEALARRYAGPEYLEPEAMQPHVEAYADAMRQVATRFPDDPDVLALAAEAAMNVRPWKLWDAEGDPAPGTEAIVATLERALSIDPDHPGANHYFIHAIEASRDPGRALPSAERLPRLMPGAGHTVHMPAHIFQRVGRYADASAANRAAIEADRRYLARVTPPGYYPMYLAHNHGFLAYSASMEGRAEESLAASRESASTMPMDLVCTMPGMDFFMTEPLLVLVRFGRWDELLAEPEPHAHHPVHAALYRHARGMALASSGRTDEARRELAELDRIRGEIPEDLLTGLNEGRLVLELAAKVLEARIAERAGEDSIPLWEQAVALEDRLSYNEPADWFYPTRHFLGAALLDAGRAADAERVFREDLEKNPENGWALFGLTQALGAQRGRAREAAAARERFQRVWARADVQLQRSAL